MTRRAQIDDLYDLTIPAQPVLSPDGRKIVYVLRTTDREAEPDRPPAVGDRHQRGQARRITRGAKDSSPAWSPDGTKIAFLRDDQVWLLEAGEPWQATTLPLGAGAPRWSPDGTKIAFTAIVGPDEADRADRGEPPGLQGPTAAASSGRSACTVHVLDVESGDVPAGDLRRLERRRPAWSPDGVLLAFSAARDADADLNFRSAAYVVEIGGEPRLVGTAEGSCRAVVWTADGSALLVVGRTGTEVGNERLLRVPLEGETVDLAESLDRNVMSGEPSYPGRVAAVCRRHRVTSVARDRGCTHLFAVRDGQGPAGVGRRRKRCVRCGRCRRQGRRRAGHADLVRRDRSGRPGQRRRRGANRPRRWRCDALFPRGKGIRHLRRHGRARVPAARPRAGRPAALVLDIHGGPHNAWSGAADSVRGYQQVLAARGWAVLLLNVRASDGYGEEFFTAAVGGWGTADAKDFLEPLDQLVAEGVADPERLAGRRLQLWRLHDVLPHRP